MHYGVEVVTLGDYADPRPVVRLAQAAEAAGWEGLFIWDHLAFAWGVPSGDPWVMLAAVAQATKRIKIGTAGDLWRRAGRRATGIHRLWGSGRPQTARGTAGRGAGCARQPLVRRDTISSRPTLHRRQRCPGSAPAPATTYPPLDRR